MSHQPPAEQEVAAGGAEAVRRNTPGQAAPQIDPGVSTPAASSSAATGPDGGSAATSPDGGPTLGIPDGGSAGPPRAGTGGAALRTALAALALVVAVLAAAAAGFSWWQSAERYSLLEASERRALASLEKTLETTQTREGDAAQRLAALEQGLEAERRRATAMSGRVDGLPERVDALEQRVEAGSGSSDARSEWLRSEAEYYLSVANTELTLGGRWQTAITALGLADDRVRQLSDPSFAPVREAIADELLELQGVKLPDLEGLALRLGRLAAHVEELPLRTAGAATGASADGAPAATPVEAAKPGLARLWLTVKGALAGIVSVRRNDEPAAEALTADERSLARRQLQLELELARAAALGAEPAAFAASLDNAQALLARDFDPRSEAVASAAMLLTQLADVDVAPKRPDISKSLALFRRVGGKN